MDEGVKPIVLLGPTSVGKTSVSIPIAKKLGCEIISVDSRLVYKELNIGPAKPTENQLEEIPHNIINVTSIDKRFTVADFKMLYNENIDEIAHHSKLPFLVGGTPLYFVSLLNDWYFGAVDFDKNVREELKQLAEIKGSKFLYEKLLKIDSEIARKIHSNDLFRIIRAIEIYYSSGKKPSDMRKEFNEDFSSSFICIGLDSPRDLLYETINKRVDEMLEKGLVKEVQEILNSGFSPDLFPLKSFGYKQIIDYLNGKYDLNFAVEEIKMQTRRFAKRQISWFKRMKGIKWFDISDFKSSDMLVKEIISYILQML